MIDGRMVFSAASWRWTWLLCCLPCRRPAQWPGRNSRDDLTFTLVSLQPPTPPIQEARDDTAADGTSSAGRSLRGVPSGHFQQMQVLTVCPLTELDLRASFHCNALQCRYAFTKSRRMHLDLGVTTETEHDDRIAEHEFTTLGRLGR